MVGHPLREDDAGLAWVLDMYGGEISTAPKKHGVLPLPVRPGRGCLRNTLECRRGARRVAERGLLHCIALR